MKRFLLTMTAVASALMASAQWVKPTIGNNEMSPLAVDEEVYLYNTGTGLFLCQGNANGVQASLAEEGMRMKVEKYVPQQEATDEGETPSVAEWDGKTYTLRDFNTVQNKWYYVYIDGNGGCYMNGGKPADYLWELEAQAGGTYRIHCAEANPTHKWSKNSNCYLGLELVDGGMLTSIIYPFMDITEIEETSEFCIDWAFVSEAVYVSYREKVKVYDTAMKLKAAMDECREKGLDVSGLQGVYDNTSSTLEELQAALAQAEALASAEDEKNVTSKR